MTLKVAMIPLNIIWENKAANLKNVENILRNIDPDTDLVIFPETFSTGFPSGETKEHVSLMAENHPDETISFLKSNSQKYNMAIAGSYIAKIGDGLVNYAFFIKPSGDDFYAAKHHLFSMAGENNIFEPGDTRVSAILKGFNISMIVCYDLRFPVWCRNVDNEYDLLIAVANWPEARIDAWNKLLFARAIENQSYVCGVNCSGTDKHGYNYNGSTMAIDFKGKDISIDRDINLTDSIQKVFYATLDLNKLTAFRKKFPAWRDADRFYIR